MIRNWLSPKSEAKNAQKLLLVYVENYVLVSNHHKNPEASVEFSMKSPAFNFGNSTKSNRNFSESVVKLSIARESLQESNRPNSCCLSFGFDAFTMTVWRQSCSKRRYGWISWNRHAINSILKFEFSVLVSLWSFLSSSSGRRWIVSIKGTIALKWITLRVFCKCETVKTAWNLTFTVF